jgi:hypothetical protein
LLEPQEENISLLQRLAVATPQVEILLRSIDDQVHADALRMASPPVSAKFLAPQQQALQILTTPESPKL